MGFKDYISESLIITEAKVKVGGKEFSSKREAAIAMAEAGKKVEFIMKAIGTTEAMAKHFVSKYGKKKTDGITPATKGQQALDKENANRKKESDDDKKAHRLHLQAKSARESGNEAVAKALERKIKEMNIGVKKEPKKTKAMEHKEVLDAYKKGDKYKPEPIKTAPLKDTKGSGAKEWMKKHGNDSSKQKDLKAIEKEIDKLATEYDRLEDKERRLKNKGDISLIGAVEKRMDEIKNKMVRLEHKAAELR